MGNSYGIYLSKFQQFQVQEHREEGYLLNLKSNSSCDQNERALRVRTEPIWIRPQDSLTICPHFLLDTSGLCSRVFDRGLPEPRAAEEQSMGKLGKRASLPVLGPRALHLASLLFCIPCPLFLVTPYPTTSPLLTLLSVEVIILAGQL